MIYMIKLLRNFYYGLLGIYDFMIYSGKQFKNFYPENFH